MKLFITGATGFIGKNLIQKLIKDGEMITINLHNDNVSPFGDSVSTYSLGKKSIEEDIEFFKKYSFDGIIHLASLYITTHKPQDINYLIDSNIKFGTYVLECAAQAKIKWFINTGTFWQHYQDRDYSPVNLYAATKQAFDDIAKYYEETNQIQFVTLKLSDTYGPNDTRPKIFNLWEKIAKSGELLKMSGGEQLINISYISDIVEAFYLLAIKLNNKENKIPNGATYAVKAENVITLKELASKFEKASGSKLNIEWGSLPYREREVMRPWSDGKIVPGWEQKVDIEKGLRIFLNK